MSSEAAPDRSAAIIGSLLLARDGNSAALGLLLDHYREYLLRIAGEELSSGLEVKVAPSDLVQETFLEASKAFPDFRGTSEAELRVWLRQILFNNLLDATKYWTQTRKRSAPEEPLDPGDDSVERGYPVVSSEPSPSAVLGSEEDQRRVRAALNNLPSDYQQVIQLRTIEARSFEEVAAAMHRSPGAVQKLWSRAVERLAEMLDESLGHDPSSR